MHQRQKKFQSINNIKKKSINLHILFNNKKKINYIIILE